MPCFELAHDFYKCLFRLVVLSLRAQSLLNLKLYKMKRHELKDYQKAIQDVLANSEDEQASAEHGQNRTEQMSTPSPAGSEGSNDCCAAARGPGRAAVAQEQVLAHVRALAHSLAPLALRSWIWLATHLAACT